MSDINIHNTYKLKECLSKGDYENYTDENGKTLLHKAIHFGSFNSAKLILCEYKSLINKKCHRGFTALHSICYGKSDKNIKFLKFFLENGANPLELCEHNYSLALHFAFSNGHLEYGKILLEFSNINEVDGDCYTILHLAAKNASYDCIKYLVENNANYDLLGKDGKTPLDLLRTRSIQVHRKYVYLIKIQKFEQIAMCAATSENEYIDNFMDVFTSEIMSFLF